MTDTRTEHRFPFDATLAAMAERELAAFTGAVNDLFGSEQARQSAEDWLEQLALIDWPTGETISDLRQITIAAAARLAGRINARMEKRKFS